jgi:hypothetical protein
MAVASFCVVQQSPAATIIGGSTLLSPADANQLETWLGEGSIALTNIFTKTTGDGQTSIDFHTAVDGMGRTFSVIEVLPGTYESLPAYMTIDRTIIGGYDPLSWSSTDGWHLTYTDAERTAFLFNLTSLVKHSQHLLSDSYGEYQTYNGAGFGPTFGGGYDLSMYSDLSSGGYAYNVSYGPPSFTQNILSGEAYYTGGLNYGTIEVFTIAGAAVPEPSAWILWSLLGGVGIGLSWWRRRKAA